MAGQGLLAGAHLQHPKNGCHALAAKLSGLCLLGASPLRLAEHFVWQVFAHNDCVVHGLHHMQSMRGALAAPAGILMSAMAGRQTRFFRNSNLATAKVVKVAFALLSTRILLCHAFGCHRNSVSSGRVAKLDNRCKLNSFDCMQPMYTIISGSGISCTRPCCDTLALMLCWKWQVHNCCALIYLTFG